MISRLPLAFLFGLCIIPFSSESFVWLPLLLVFLSGISSAAGLEMSTGLGSGLAPSVTNGIGRGSGSGDIVDFSGRAEEHYCEVNYVEKCTRSRYVRVNFSHSCMF